MKNIQIPATAAEYQVQVINRAVPDKLISEHPFYKNLLGWVIDNRTPIIYDQDHDSEYANFSINCNWLLRRDYNGTKLGPPDTILSMYSLHESTHMTNWLPTRLDEISAEEYANQFTLSEYRASNETEILAHYRIPGLREKILPFKIAYDVLREQEITQPSAAELARLRPVMVEDTKLDGIFAGYPAILQFLKGFQGNRQWATDRFDIIKPYFQNRQLPLGYGLTNAEYEPVITAYQPDLPQARYETNILRNVRLGYAMCGLAIPKLKSLADALSAGLDLEGSHAVV